MPRKMEKGSDIPQGGGVSSNALDLYRQRAEDERKIESRNFAKAQKTINDIASWFWNKEVQEQIRSVGAEADGFKRLYHQYVNYARYNESLYGTTGNKVFLEYYSECARELNNIRVELEILIRKTNVSSQQEKRGITFAPRGQLEQVKHFDVPSSERAFKAAPLEPGPDLKIYRHAEIEEDHEETSYTSSTDGFDILDGF